MTRAASQRNLFSGYPHCSVQAELNRSFLWWHVSYTITITV